MNRNFIGLLGKKGSGKDSAADALEAQGYYRTSFAKALRKELKDAFKFLTDEMLENRSLKETPVSALDLSNCRDLEFERIALEVCNEERRLHKGEGWMINPITQTYVLSPRKVLQLWGTEYRRAKDPMYWVKKVDEEIWQAEAHYGSGPEFKVVITDLRFPDEVEFVKEIDGFVVKIERPDNPYEKVGSSNHSSESQIDEMEYDILVVNDGTLDDLHTTILKVTKG